jgi:hypothetical protein
MRRLLVVLAYVVVCVGISVAIAGLPELNPEERTLLGAGATPVEATTSTTSGAAGESPLAPTTTTAAAPAPTRPPGEVRVRFYNGSSKAGAATLAGRLVADDGYVIEPPGASVEPRPEATQVWFTEGWEAEGRALAAAVGLPPERAAAMPSPAPVDKHPPAVIVVVVADDLAARLG